MNLQPHLVSFLSQLTGLAIWLVLLSSVFIPLERIFGNHGQPVFRRSFATDVGYYFVNGILPKLLLILPLTAIAAGLHRTVPSAFYQSMADVGVYPKGLDITKAYTLRFVDKRVGMNPK